MPSLTASRVLTYNTRRLQPGDTFDASTRDARVLVAIKKATWSKPKVEAAPEAPAETAGPPAAPDPEAPAADEAALDALRAAAEALGIKVDGRWKQARLAKEIAAAKPAEG